MKKLSNEVKIGIFVVLAACVGVFFWAKTQKLAKDTYNIKTSFGYAGGLKENAIVLLSGIEVGRVENLDFKYEPDTRVEVLLEVKKAARIHTDSIAYIDTSGFLGDALVGLTAGTAEAPFVTDGTEIESEDPFQAREFAKKAQSIAEKLDETLVDVRELARNVNVTYKDNQGNIDRIIKNLEETSGNFKEFSRDIKKNPWKLFLKEKEKKK